ncbi:MAG: dihydrofolate reductase family protein, partial [Actinomadura sp.]
MRKIINSTYVSLDGVIENPQNWTSAYFQEEAAAYAQDLLFSCGALLMGRRTYDGFAEAWPAMEESTGEFGVRMNTYPHYVVSDSLENPGWGDTTVIRRADAAARIAELKEQDGGDILQYGFGPVSRTLVEHGLLDELRLRMLAVGTPLRDLLDAQGLAWWLVRRPPPEDWDQADRAAFEAFRKGGTAPTVTPTIEESSVQAGSADVALPAVTPDLAARLHLPES